MQNISDETIDEMVVIKNYLTEHNGVQTVWLNQMYEGIPVFEGNVRFAFDRIGRIWWVDTAMSKPGLKADTKIEVVGESRTLTAGDGRFTDEFGPLQEHVYKLGAQQPT